MIEGNFTIEAYGIVTPPLPQSSDLVIDPDDDDDDEESED